MKKLIAALAILSFGLIVLSAVQADTPKVYIGIVVAYQDGKPIAAQAIGFAASESDCTKGMTLEVSKLTAKPGVQLVAMCTAAPPAPAIEGPTPKTHSLPLPKSGTGNNSERV